MILETSRLILRPFREDDVDILAPLMANRDFMRFSLGPYDREQTAALLQKILEWDHANRPSLFAIILRLPEQESGSNNASAVRSPGRVRTMLLGYCGFYHQNIDGIAEIEIGYRIHPEYWNQGLTTEAARRVCDYAFTDLQLPRVISLIHPENAASRRVVEKIGMTLEKDTIYRGFPTHVFSLTREGWLERSVV
jgi:RimJ/RimL family protein N-acetyltransferase